MPDSFDDELKTYCNYSVMKSQHYFPIVCLFILHLLLSRTDGAPLVAGYVLRGGPSGAVVENFDSMFANGVVAPGTGEHTFWSINVGNVERATNLFTANTFPSNGGFNGGPWGDSGLSPDSDRALGVYAGAVGDNTRALIMLITNQTGADLTRFELRFDVEVWIVRNSGPSRYGGLQASFSTNSITWHDLGDEFEAVFTYPDQVEASSANYWVDGNAPENSRRNIGGWVENVFVPAGQAFYLRFDAHGPTLTDPDGAGPYVNRQIGVALDNLLIQAEATVIPAQVIIPPQSLNFSQGAFSFTLPVTELGKSYTLEYTPSLPASEWTPVMNVSGNGQPAAFNHTPPANRTGFYRLRVD